MIDRVKYYVDLLISLCGFDGSDDSLIVGWIVVVISTMIVIYAFYQAITKAIWPGEKDTNHIKYQIFDTDWQEEIELGESERAN